MVCVQCGNKTSVVNSRSQKRLNQVWRRRHCQTCGAVFTTEESLHAATAWAVRHPSGRLEPFLRDKLLLSLYKSCEHRKTALSDAGGLTATVMHKLVAQAKNGVISSQQIARTAQVALNRFDTAASVRYKAFHE